MKPSSASLIVDALKQNEIRLITVLPDSWMFEVYELISKDSYFKVVPVTHEAEGVWICAGAWCVGLAGRDHYGKFRTALGHRSPRAALLLSGFVADQSAALRVIQPMAWTWPEWPEKPGFEMPGRLESLMRFPAKRSDALKKTS